MVAQHKKLSFLRYQAGVGTFTGEADLSANFVVSSLAFVLQSNGATFEFAFTQSADGVKLKPGVSSQDINFTQTSTAIRKASGVGTASVNFTQTANGDILYEEIVPADNETYTTITPSGTETWTEITPSGTETYTEIDA